MKDKLFNMLEFEDLLKSKIDSLSSSVDCFDKISSKAFPEKSKKLNDEGYVICDLENITGKKKKFSFIPAVALAVVTAVCIAFIPKTGFINSFFSKITESDKNMFIELVKEINEITDDDDYIYFDYTLDEYIKNDITITPLYKCPFEQNDHDDVKVRIFIKTSGSIHTNQIYVVQYDGDFDNGNYIAIADSKAKFDDNELNNTFSLPSIKNKTISLIENSFPQKNYFLTSDGITPVFVSSFNYNCLYKIDDEIFPISNEIVMYSEKNNLETFNFDYVSLYVKNNSFESFDTSAFENNWNNVIYFNGNSAKTENNNSDFKRTDILSDTLTDNNFQSTLKYFSPYQNINDYNYLYVYNKVDGLCGYSFNPINDDLKKQLKIYTCNQNNLFSITNRPVDTDLLDINFNISPYNADNDMSDSIINYKNGIITSITTSSSSGSVEILINDTIEKKLVEELLEQADHEKENK